MEINARSCIIRALMELMEIKSYDDITVSEICDRAGYNRISYYRNFTSKEDILTQMLNTITKEFQSGMVLHRGEYFASSAARMFEFMKTYHKQLMMLHSARMDYILLEALNTAFYHTIPEDTTYSRYDRAFQSGGYFYVVLKWMESGMKESTEEMGKILADIVENSTIK